MKPPILGEERESNSPDPSKGACSEVPVPRDPQNARGSYVVPPRSMHVPLYQSECCSGWGGMGPANPSTSLPGVIAPGLGEGMQSLHGEAWDCILGIARSPEHCAGSHPGNFYIPKNVEIKKGEQLGTPRSAQGPARRTLGMGGDPNPDPASRLPAGAQRAGSPAGCRKALGRWGGPGGGAGGGVRAAGTAPADKSPFGSAGGRGSPGARPALPPAPRPAARTAPRPTRRPDAPMPRRGHGRGARGPAHPAQGPRTPRSRAAAPQAAPARVRAPARSPPGRPRPAAPRRSPDLRLRAPSRLARPARPATARPGAARGALLPG